MERGIHAVRRLHVLAAFMDTKPKSCAQNAQQSCLESPRRMGSAPPSIPAMSPSIDTSIMAVRTRLGAMIPSRRSVTDAFTCLVVSSMRKEEPELKTVLVSRGVNVATTGLHGDTATGMEMRTVSPS